MKAFLVYWVWPNPGGWHYNDPKVMAVLVACAALVFLSLVLRYWRKTLTSPVTRNLSASWSSALFWFGVVAAVMVVSRVETIQFVSMRLLWVIWLVSFALYFVFQIMQFRRRHYVVLKRAHVLDERDRYLPKKGR
jgi:small-conductance mechanosensitive channel